MLHNNYSPVYAEKSLESTELDRDPLGGVPGGGRRDLQELELGPYPWHTMSGRRERAILKRIFMKSTASFPHFDSISDSVHFVNCR